MAADASGFPTPPPGPEDGSVSAHTCSRPAGVDKHGCQTLLLSSGHSAPVQKPCSRVYCKLYFNLSISYYCQLYISSIPVPVFNMSSILKSQPLCLLHKQ